ncbi:hypothetical protein HDV00_010252 [Rhizophlyctis rosea]|nr:hypothetical protein HDV00_010252 [Rhizophlyctis rosea]
MFSAIASALGNGPPPRKTEAEIRELVASKLIKQAGVDFESRPLLVFYACYLPDPATADYDVLLNCVLGHLDQFVESDYVMVFFASGGNFAPSWAWIFRTYANLSRKYRKNLKNLFIVHPTMWPKLLMQFMGAVVSPKFARKVIWVYSLSSLAKLVPIERLDIPPIIHDVNAKYERPSRVAPETMSRSLSSVTESRQFGGDLESLMGPNAEKGIPVVVTDCISVIRTYGRVPSSYGNNEVLPTSEMFDRVGLDAEGIFRRSPASRAVQAAKKAYDQGERPLVSSPVEDVHIACVLLKMYFRDLPQALFPGKMYEIINGISKCTTPEDQATYISSTIFPLLTAPAKMLFIALFDLLHEVHEHSTTNLMHAQNLAIVWAPNLVKSDNPGLDFAMCAGGGGVGSLVKTTIEKWPLEGIAAAFVEEIEKGGVVQGM